MDEETRIWNEIRNSLRDSNLIEDSRFEREGNYIYIVLGDIDVDEIFSLLRIRGVTHVVVNPNDESTIQVNLSF